MKIKTTKGRGNDEVGHINANIYIKNVDYVHSVDNICM